MDLILLGVQHNVAGQTSRLANTIPLIRQRWWEGLNLVGMEFSEVPITTLHGNIKLVKECYIVLYTLICLPFLDTALGRGLLNSAREFFFIG